MGAMLLLLLLAIVLFGAGFAVKALWYVAVVLFIVWLIGMFTGRTRTGVR
jgi:hypothetical protein